MAKFLVPIKRFMIKRLSARERAIKDQETGMTDTNLEGTGLRAHEHLEWKDALERDVRETEKGFWDLQEAF